MRSTNTILSKLSPSVLVKFAFLFAALSLAMCIFWVYNIFNSRMSTLYVLLFGYTVFSFLGVAYFLWRRGHFDTNDASLYQPRSRSFLYFALLFVIIYIRWIFSIVGHIYTKPIAYYVLSSIAFVLISLQIIFMREAQHERYIPLIFIQILAFAFFLRISSYIVNPNLIGPDTVYHFNNIQSMIEEGYSSPNFFHYHYFPSYYCTQSVAGILISFSKFSLELINAFQSVIPVILGYAIGKEIFGDSKTALMSSLMVSIAPMSIFCSVYNTSKIGALSLFLMVLWLLLKIMKSKKIEYLTLLVVVLVALFFWHPELSLPIFGLLFASLCAYMLTVPGTIKNSVIIKKPPLYFSLLLVLYTVIYLWYLMFIHTSLGESIIDTIFFDKSGTTLVNTFAPTLVGGADFVYIIQLIFSGLGLTLPLFFAVYLGFRWLLRPNWQEIFLLLTIIFLHLNPLLGVLSGKFELGGERALIATSILIAIVSAGGIIELFKMNRRNQILLFIFAMLILSFSSTSSYLIGDGNDVFNDRISIQIMYNTQTKDSSTQFVRHVVPSPQDIQWATRSISQVSPEDNGYILTDYLSMSYLSRSPSLDNDLRSMLNSKTLVYSNGNNALTWG